MRLHDSIGPNPRVVRMAMAEKGLAVETMKVDLMGGENRRADYLARVPTGGLPALELDDGRCIGDIMAIIEYVDETATGPALFGTTPAERAEARMWTRRIDLAIVEPMTTAFRATEGRQLFASRMTLMSETAAAEMKAVAQEKLLWLDEQLAGRTWVCGERHTVADLLLLAFVEFGASVGQPMPAAATWLPEWQARAAARPSAAA